jgi:hypothetical protein
MSDPIRVFVGCAANGEDLESQAVLEHSLRKHASRPVDIVWMRLDRTPGSAFFSDGPRGWQTQNWSTPFSGFRWAVPELCGFRGRAIYCDSDVIFLADAAELWDQAFQPGKVVLAKGGEDSWRFCVCLWDCAAAAAYVKPLKLLMREPGAHRAMIERYRNAPFVQPFEGNWNCIDLEDYGDLSNPEIKVLHYSSEAHQPHLRHAVPRLKAQRRRHWFDGQMKPHWRFEVEELFDAVLKEAIEAGYTLDRYEPEQLFGAYRKMSHAKGYRSHRFAPA